MRDSLLEINCNFEVFLDTIELSIKEIYALKRGSVIELNRKVDDLATVFVNSNYIGEGEITIKNLKYAIKMNKLKFKENIW